MSSLPAFRLAAAMAVVMMTPAVAGSGHLQCPQEYTVAGSRNLAVASGGTAIPLYSNGSTNVTAQAPNSRTLTLYYIVPATQYATGALIVKARHTPVAPLSNEGPATISLQRPAYSPACFSMGRAKVLERTRNSFYGEYTEPVRLQEYEDFHFSNKRVYDPQSAHAIDRFHAELGDRDIDSVETRVPKFFGARSNTICVKTDHRILRQRLLFRDVTPGEPIFAGIKEFLAAAFSAPKPEDAEAATLPEYKDYIGLSATILPYTKDAGKSRCVAFTVPIPAPSLIAKSEIMIVDADDALVAGGYTIAKTDDEVYIPRSAQKSWTIEWQP